MLKVRVIPTLLWKNFGLVKGVGFDSWRRVGPVLPAIKVYNTREVDELVLVDILAHAGQAMPGVRRRSGPFCIMRTSSLHRHKWICLAWMSVTWRRRSRKWNASRVQRT